MPGDVLERLTGLAPGDLVPEPWIEVGVGHPVQLAAAHAVHVRGDQLRVGPRRVHAHLGEPGGRDSDLIEQKAHRPPLLSRTWSASTREVITASRSPSIT